MTQTNVAVALNEEDEEETEKKFAEFIGRKGIPYEKTLMTRRFDAVTSILKGENPPPYELEIQPSSKCNAHCTHCWARKIKSLENRLNTEPAMKRVVNQVLDFQRNGFKVETIKFCGTSGEPLVNPLTLYAIDMIYGKRFLRLFTNGIKLAENRDNRTYLKSLSKINILNLSLDAGSTQTLHQIKPGSTHISLEEILQAANKIRNLSENGTQIEVSYVITNSNYQEIAEATRKVRDFEAAGMIQFRIDLTDRTVSQMHGEEIIELLEEAKLYGSENFKVIPVYSETEITQKDENYFSSKRTRSKCFISKFWTCIGSNGCLYPCGHIVAPDTENYGNILEQDFPDIWDSKQRKYVISKLPGSKCNICSPFSLRANEFMTFLSGLPLKEVLRLQKKYFRGKT
jgi:radical SAM protein with 4Fe4S-binding SPASM domain